MAMEGLAESLRGPVVDMERMTLREAVEEGVYHMSDGRLRAVPLLSRGAEVNDNHQRYALQADGITVGEMVVEGELTSRLLYAGVRGVLYNQPGTPVAIITPVPKSRQR